MTRKIKKDLEQVDDGRFLVQDEVNVDVGSLLCKLLDYMWENLFFPNLPQEFDNSKYLPQNERFKNSTIYTDLNH